MKRLAAEHQVLISYPDDVLHGYFGWPTLIRMENGTLVAGASGFRTNHVCPFGQTVLFESKNYGRSWEAPYIVNNSPIDDRDVGLLDLGGGKLLVSYFCQDTRKIIVGAKNIENRPLIKPRFDLTPIFDSWDDELVNRTVGSYIRVREADGKWREPVKVPVSSPHGPVKMNDGSLLLVGGINGHNSTVKEDFFKTKAFRSDDDGRTWKELSTLPGAPEGGDAYFCEPYPIQMPDGRIIVMQRHVPGFALYQSVSDDGGLTWSKPEFIIEGSPAHLILHSSGVLICSYSYRKPGYGQRIMLSSDGGRSYEPYILRATALISTSVIHPRRNCPMVRC